MRGTLQAQVGACLFEEAGAIITGVASYPYLSECREHLVDARLQFSARGQVSLCHRYRVWVGNRFADDTARVPEHPAKAVQQAEGCLLRLPPLRGRRLPERGLYALPGRQI